LKIRLHTRWEEAAVLAGPWNDLLSASASDTPFLTWEWCDSWWKSYGAGRPVMVLSTWEDDTLAGIAPFFVDTESRWGTSWQVLRLIGDGSHDSDYLDCFARRGSEREFVAATVDELRKHQDKWDWLELHGTPESSPVLAGVLDCARERGWRHASEPIPCATLALPARWDDYLKTLKPRMRTKVRSAMAFFEERLKAAPRESLRPEDTEEWLPLLFDLHSRRWESAGQPGVFKHEVKRNFYREISRRMAHRGWLAFHRLDWEGRAVALQFGFQYNRRFFLLQEGYDPDFSVVRPGLALRGMMMRHWIESGFEEYDFLAGMAGYKRDWGGQPRMAVRLAVAPSGSAARVAVDVPQWMDRTKEKMRPLVPEKVLALKKKLAGSPASGKAAPANGSGPLLKRVAAELYSSTPLRRLGAALASHYEWSPGRDPKTSKGWRAKSGTRCQVFIYHRVNDDADPFLPALSTDVFRWQMEYLAKNFPVVRLDDLVTGNLPKNSGNHCVAITFDDGYRDNYTNAFPILRELGLPASIFLISGCMEGDVLPWYDQVSLAFKITTAGEMDFHAAGGPSGSMEGRSQRLSAMRNTLNWLWAMQEPERLRWTQELFAALRLSAAPLLPNYFLDWNQVREMSRQNIEFGAHTVTHPVLTRVTGERLREELAGSKKAIESRLQREVRHLAYPFGGPQDFSEETKAAARECGFASALTTLWGFNQAGDDPYELRRFSLWETDPSMFALKLDWYRLTEPPERPRSDSLF
jgi:CelD/BcsL family acetyltransferase involved in cellulose biosynthesis/peptidoglycan/xylan/chitin deacetylase (PgdA/CDA1 family)